MRKESGNMLTGSFGSRSYITYEVAIKVTVLQSCRGLTEPRELISKVIHSHA